MTRRVGADQLSKLFKHLIFKENFHAFTVAFSGDRRPPFIGVISMRHMPPSIRIWRAPYASCPYCLLLPALLELEGDGRLQRKLNGLNEALLKHIKTAKPFILHIDLLHPRPYGTMQGYYRLGEKSAKIAAGSPRFLCTEHRP